MRCRNGTLCRTDVARATLPVMGSSLPRGLPRGLRGRCADAVRAPSCDIRTHTHLRMRIRSSTSVQQWATRHPTEVSIGRVRPGQQCWRARPRQCRHCVARPDTRCFIALTSWRPTGARRSARGRCVELGRAHRMVLQGDGGSRGGGTPRAYGGTGAFQGAASRWSAAAPPRPCSAHRRQAAALDRDGAAAAAAGLHRWLCALAGACTPCLKMGAQALMRTTEPLGC